jgi:hypothetical protein
MGELERLEEKGHLMAAFAPGGKMERQRKVFSYAGAIQGPAGEYDPGNWVYAVIARCFVNHLQLRHTLQQLSEYNDGTLGDVFEAILGLIAHCRRGTAQTDVDDVLLGHYVEVITELCHCVERIWVYILARGWWLDSKITAQALL